MIIKLLVVVIKFIPHFKAQKSLSIKLLKNLTLLSDKFEYSKFNKLINEMVRKFDLIIIVV